MERRTAFTIYVVALFISTESRTDKNSSEQVFIYSRLIYLCMSQLPRMKSLDWTGI